MFLSVKKRPCKVGVGSETEDVVVVPTVHMTHFCWLGTGYLEVWTIKIRFKKKKGTFLVHLVGHSRHMC